MRFTAKYIENLKPADKRFVKYEDNARGRGSLGIRVNPSGTKSWVHMYYVNGKVRMSTLGRYPRMSVAEAHEVYARLAREVAEGGDPSRDIVIENVRRREAPRVEDLAAIYIEKWAKPRKRSWKQDQSMIKRDVLPTIGHLRVEDVKRRDIIDLLDRVVARGAAIQANRVLALVRKMFNFGIGRDLVEHNPCAQVQKPARENRRERVLNDVELRILLAKIPECQMWRPTQLALLFLLLTAQRPGEVVGARWEEMDLAGGWWTIPGSRAKNRLSHRVPLSPQALALLEEARGFDRETGAVFPSRIGGGAMVHSVLSTALRRSRPVIGIAHFTAHDLRRTAASHMTSLGVSRLVVSKLLNHVESGVTAVYDRHSYDQEKRRGLELWGQRVAELGFDANFAPHAVNARASRSEIEATTAALAP